MAKATKKKPPRVKPSKPAKAKPKEKPAKPRKAARQQDIPETREHEPDKDFDTMAHDAYDKTLTWQGAAVEARNARKKVMEALKKKLEGSEVNFYTTPSGLRVTLERSKETLHLKLLDKTDTLELDPDE